MGGEDRQGVLDGQQRIGVSDLAGARDARMAQELDRDGQPVGRLLDGLVGVGEIVAQSSRGEGGTTFLSAPCETLARR